MNECVDRVCPYCGTVIAEGQNTTDCSSCGTVHHESCWSANGGCAVADCAAHQHTTPAAAPTGTAPSSYYLKVQRRRKTIKKLILILVAVALLTAAGVGIGASHSRIEKAADQKSEASCNEYLTDVKAFRDLALTAGFNLLDVVDKIQEEWYKCVEYYMYGEDVYKAVEAAMLLKAKELADAEEYDRQVKELYAKVKNIPEGLNEEDTAKMRQVRAATEALYNAYCDLYGFTTVPSGNYKTYRDTRKVLVENFNAYYAELDQLLK